MSAIGTRVAALQERLQDLLASMSPRDRSLFIGMVTALIFAVVFGSVYAMNRSLSSLDQRIDDREQTLQLVTVMAEEYQASSAQVEQIEAELRRHAGTDLSAFLEQSAEKTGIKAQLDAVKEKSTAEEGSLQEKLYAVSLSDLETSQLASFLVEIETAGFPMKIRSLKVKTRGRAGEKKLRVDMDVSAFKLLETEPDPGTDPAADPAAGDEGGAG